MSQLGQKRKSGDAIATSDLPLKADLADQARHVGFVPIGDSAAQQTDTYSITSSARLSSVSGTVRSSALAVLRLIASTYVVGCCTGKLAGLAPLRIRSTYEAARRQRSVLSIPYEISP